jgi:hypothetical protein
MNAKKCVLCITLIVVLVLSLTAFLLPAGTEPITDPQNSQGSLSDNDRLGDCPCMDGDPCEPYILRPRQ